MLATLGAKEVNRKPQNDQSVKGAAGSNQKGLITEDEIRSNQQDFSVLLKRDSIETTNGLVILVFSSDLAMICLKRKNKSE